MRWEAWNTLLHLDPATLARHADSLAARLEDSDGCVRKSALMTLGKLEPATLARHAFAVVARFENPTGQVREMACHKREMFPRYVRYATRGVDYKRMLSRALDRGDYEYLRSRLLGRIAGDRCRVRLRVRSLSLYWYALPYHPSGPGHARDVETWNHMIEE